MKYLYLPLLLFIGSIAASAQDISIEVECSPVVSVRETFTITYTINTELNDAEPELEGMNGFEIVMGPTRSNATYTQMVNGDTSTTKSTSYTYVVIATSHGRMIIPQISVNVMGRRYSSAAKAITVKPADYSSVPQEAETDDKSVKQTTTMSAGSRENGGIFVRTELTEEGFSYLAVVKLYSGNPVSSLGKVRLPDFSGFYIEDITAGGAVEEGSEKMYGKQYNTYILKRYRLTPLYTGSIIIGEGEYEVRVRERTNGRSANDFFGSSTDTEESYVIRSPGVEINVDNLSPALELQSSFFPEDEEIILGSIAEDATNEEGPPESAEVERPKVNVALQYVLLGLLMIAVLAYLNKISKSRDQRDSYRGRATTDRNRTRTEKGSPAHLPYLIAIFLLIVMLVAAPYMPQLKWPGNDGKPASPVEELSFNVAYVMDRSVSMGARDLDPSRFGASVEAVEQHLAFSEVDYDPALVLFSDVAELSCPVDREWDTFFTMLDSAAVITPEVYGSAVGHALALALGELSRYPDENNIVILLTDGNDDRRIISPGTAADIASALGIRIYIIGVCTDYPTPLKTGIGSSRNVTMIEPDIDEDCYRLITHRTGGKYYRVTHPSAFPDVMLDIDQSLSGSPEAGQLPTARLTPDEATAILGFVLNETDQGR